MTGPLRRAGSSSAGGYTRTHDGITSGHGMRSCGKCNRFRPMYLKGWARSPRWVWLCPDCSKPKGAP